VRIQDEAFARYQETHEGHFDYTGREKWAYQFCCHNFLPHLTRPVGHRMLEIGCGAGDMLRVFRKKGFSAVGTDLCKDNVSRDSKVFLHDVLTKPFRNTQLDVIVMMGVIEHIRKDDLLSSLRNVRSMLAPGGVLFITTQNMDSPLGDHFRYLDITHELGFTRESLNQVGRLAGFKPECFPVVNPTVPERGLRKLVKGLWRRLYRVHVRVCGGAMADTWWEHDGLLGVWR
jgi:SAM-dependent methyltransferase